MPNPNIEILLEAATKLRPVLDEVVFVGGCVTGLLVSDVGAAAIRPTFDVDVIAKISSYAEYAKFSEKLRGLGFAEDKSEGAPICRWVSGQLKLDVMPLDESILGFSNRWYLPAADHAVPYQLAPNLNIRLVAPQYFIATKLEAFKGRGAKDFFGSRDLEDLISVLDGRASIVSELESSETDVRDYVSEEIKALLNDPRFIDALPGHLLPDSASQSRIPFVLSRLRKLSGS